MKQRPLKCLTDKVTAARALAFADAVEAVPGHCYSVREILDVEDDDEAWWCVIVLTQGDDYSTAEDALKPLAEKYSGEVGH